MTAHSELVFGLLKQDLSAPRVLLDQVMTYIQDRYGYAPQDLNAFFEEKYPQLESYEVDLIFSPQYTPAEHNRLAYMPALGAHHLSTAELADIQGRLEAAQLQATYFSAASASDDEAVTVPLHEVCIDRYTKLLKLHLPLSPQVHQSIQQLAPQDSQAELNLLAREEVWQANERQALLQALLQAWQTQQSFSTVKASFLTNFLRTYRPHGIEEMDRQLESLIQSCRTDMDNVTGRGFHDEYLKALNSDNPVAKSGENNVWQHYYHMMEMAAEVKADLAWVREQPEFSPPTVVHS